MEKTIDQIVEEVRERLSKSNIRTDSGYDCAGINQVVSSDDKKAIAYETKGSSWHRGGTYGGGVSYFQGISAYDGKRNLSVSPYGCYRSASSSSACHDWDIEKIFEFTHLEGRKYEMQIGNDYYRKTFLVDFQEGKVEKTSEERLKMIEINYDPRDW